MGRLLDDLPEAAAEWDSEKNAPLELATITSGSGRKVWWKCANGHEWEAVVHKRMRGDGCPYCGRQKAWAGETDLATTNPELALEFHPTKNGELIPQSLLAGTNKKIWWQCKLGHEWQTSGATRLRGAGCPFCATNSNRIAPGLNDLATLFPEVAQTWHPTKNGTLTPQDVAPNTLKKIWWICSLGHEWEASGTNRVNSKGCPYCGHTKVLTGFNDLVTTHPELASEWHQVKNARTNPATIFAGTNKPFWWICPEGHEYEQLASNRMMGQACPVCANKTVVPGVNDLFTTNPEVRKSWDFQLNAAVDAETVVANSHRKVWWRCDRGHNWLSAVSKRTSGQGCPYCSGKKVLLGFNDMATTHPALASEWHPTKNGELEPTQVVAGTNKYCWWVCPLGHEWRTTGGLRVVQSTGCPSCATFGYDPNMPGILYFIENSELRARKIGITNAGKSRLKKFKSFGWMLIHSFESDDGSLVANLEKSLLKTIRKDFGLPQALGREEMSSIGGWTETFSIDGVSNSEIIELILNRVKELAG